MTPAERRGAALLEVDEVRGGYRADLEIVRAVTLEVRENEMVSIIGPNGAGKSTILKAIFGELRLTSGSIRWRGKKVEALRPGYLLGLGMTFLPQGHNLFPEMSVQDNLELGAFSRKDRAGVKEDIEAVYDRFPVLRKASRKRAGYLSGGQMQMLEIARALLLKPKLMLIDEPSLGLAPKAAHEVFEIIRSLRESGTAILIVEQNAEASLRMSDFAYVVELGTVRLSGPAEEVRSDPRVRKLYLGAEWQETHSAPTGGGSGSGIAPAGSG